VFKPSDNSRYMIVDVSHYCNSALQGGSGSRLSERSRKIDGFSYLKEGQIVGCAIMELERCRALVCKGDENVIGRGST
jgi:hypothetical protein